MNVNGCDNDEDGAWRGWNAGRLVALILGEQRPRGWSGSSLGAATMHRKHVRLLHYCLSVVSII